VSGLAEPVVGLRVADAARISNYVMGHLVMDDLTAIVVRRTG
jgi:hypothetical protein